MIWARRRRCSPISGLHQADDHRIIRHADDRIIRPPDYPACLYPGLSGPSRVCSIGLSLLHLCVFGLGLSNRLGRVWPPQPSYKELAGLGLGGSESLVSVLRLLSGVPRVSSLRGRRCRLSVCNKGCCEGSCVHQGLSGSGLRRGDLSPRCLLDSFLFFR